MKRTLRHHRMCFVLLAATLALPHCGKKNKPTQQENSEDFKIKPTQVAVGEPFTLKGATTEDNGLHVFRSTSSFELAADKNIYVLQHYFTSVCEQNAAPASPFYTIDGDGNDTKIASSDVEGYKQISGQFPGQLKAGKYELTVYVVASKPCSAVNLKLELRDDNKPGLDAGGSSSPTPEQPQGPQTPPPQPTNPPAGSNPGPTPNQPAPLALAELQGRWRAESTGTLRRTSGNISASGVSLQFSVSGSNQKVSLSYKICSSSSVCNGGYDLFGTYEGVIKNNQLYLSCTDPATGKLVEYAASQEVNGSVRIQLPALAKQCSPEKHGMMFMKGANGSIVMFAFDSSYGDKLNGDALIVKQ